ncbi:MAG: TIGR00730 family Rossman fold protein [Pedobacter sp.]|nr:MAG: TIGR00730 family Rossman fold protein [Pedobacter sp.]
MKSICVYCGANFDGNTELLEHIQNLAKELVDAQITLIYGGGRVGIMGEIANATLNLGGKVVGVIPSFLMDKEVGHTGLTELIITDNMHQRKQKMADLSDGFLILPGGFGTMEEFFEVLTWLQLGLHNKPIGVLNFNSFYDPLFQQLDNMIQFGFLKARNRDLVLSETNPRKLIMAMQNFNIKPDDKWFTERNLI